jgi:hypothetical protein
LAGRPGSLRTVDSERGGVVDARAGSERQCSPVHCRRARPGCEPRGPGLCCGSGRWSAPRDFSRHAWSAVLNPDLIQPIGLQSVVLYPPTVRLERAKMTQLYSAVCAYKPYAQFALLPDGARMQNDDGSQVRLGPDRLSYKERIPDNQSTYATVRDYEHIVQDFWNSFTPGIFVTQEVVLEALWPLEGMMSQDFLEGRMLRVGRDEAASLGAACAGIGLKLVFPAFATAKAVELRIEPFFRDPKYLFLALTSQDLQPVQSPSAVGERLRWLESFLGREVATFVRELALKS